VKDFGGDVIAADRVPPAFRADTVSYPYEGSREEQLASQVSMGALLPGQLGGILADQSGAVIPNARITVTQPDNGFSMSTVTDQMGRWVVSNLRTGRIKITAASPGFKTAVRDAVYDAERPSTYSFALGTAEAPALNGRDYTELKQLSKNSTQQNASANVVNLQRKVAGVLPVAIDVPRTGSSFSFVRPLVLNEETKVTFSYKSR
jgi:hypothetical protein